MIVYKEIKSKYTDPALTSDEIVAISSMEKITDEQIDKMFNYSRSICVDVSAIEKIASKFGIWRSPIVIEAWKRMYENNGWNIHYDGEDQVYRITGK